MNKFKPLTKEQMLQTAEALIALAHGREVQYFSEINGWSDCETVDTEFPHRPKPDDSHEAQLPPQTALPPPQPERDPML